jgi:hypothetical protein
MSHSETKPQDRERDTSLPEDLVPLRPDPVIEVYKRDIDRTLLRENLKLTVEQRFEKQMAIQRFAEEMRRAGRQRAIEYRPELEALIEEFHPQAD